MTSGAAIEFELWNRGGWPRVDVVGEKFHADAIRALFPTALGSRSEEYEGRAHLVPEPTNRHDPNAVAVRVQGNLIGYLAKEHAARYVRVLSALTANGHIPTTTCQVSAYEYEDWQGTDRRGRDIYRPVLEARASIVLDEPHLCVPVNLPPTKSHRVLPHGAALQVKGEENHLDVLAPLVSEHGEAWVYTTLHLMTIESGRTHRNVVELRIDDQPIGQLTPAMSSHYAPTIEHLALADQLVAAKTLLKGNPIQVEAVLHAARSHELDAAWLAPGRSHRDSPVPEPSESAVRDGLLSPLSPAVAQPVRIPPKPTAIVFQAPPGWPPPPEGWEPIVGWLPDPAWPPPPADWQFWTLR